MIGYIWLTAAIAAELAGTTLLKYTEGFSRLWPSLGCVAAYVFCFYALSKALHYMPLSIAYATWESSLRHCCRCCCSANS